MTGPADISPVRRREIIDALRRGTVPAGGLDALAVGLERFAPTVDAELEAVAGGGAAFKAVRGEYGSGKTFFARWLEQRALSRGFAVAEVQISELETPLHKLETVYRRITESLRTAAFPPSGFRPVVDAWLFTVEEEAAALAGMPEASTEQIESLLTERLGKVAQATPVFPLALRGYLKGLADGDQTTAEAVIAWMSGQPHVGAAAKRVAGVRGDIDHFLAMGFLQGLLAVLQGSRHAGLVVVLDEVETLQRMRSDARAKALNALRQWIDELDAGRYPGLYLVITGTPTFFDGRHGAAGLSPLAARLATDFGDPRFDNPRAPQIRLPGFDLDRLVEVGVRVRDLVAAGVAEPSAFHDRASDALVARLAKSVAGQLGGQIGVAPRLFLRKLVDLLDRIELIPGFTPDDAGLPQVDDRELTDTERLAARGLTADDIPL
ncbi:BREX system ATP-binding protein BrxD [Nakamurella endophytica]|uniref:ATP-binding protein n=1 Tax=Nakamurella endophytica TaxID=1748367 RepID=A0A917SVN2_9ACTN|nr:BREX system ATP-binding protein BrxD [Nakamurella endophytica]GGL99842.1 ATP-binding protein [Nakamurella endophytica]